MTTTLPAFTLPGIPADLQETIDANRRLFAGWQMMATEPDNDADDSDQDADGSDDADDSDNDAGDQLNAGGLKALQAERTQRKALQKEVGELKAFQQQFATFAAALGGADTAKTAKPEEALKALTETVGQLTHDNLVERIARKYQIEADADVNLLRAMRSEEDMQALAARLKPAAGDGDKGDKKDAKKDRKPRHDPSAGKGGGDDTGRAGSVAEVMEARRKAREAKNNK